MKKYNYDPGLAAGSIAVGGTLGILIPPSIGMILYMMISNVSLEGEARLVAVGTVGDDAFVGSD